MEDLCKIWKKVPIHQFKDYFYPQKAVWKAKTYLSNDISSFDETETFIFLDRIDNSLVFDWCSWIFQADGPGHQIATSRHCSHLKIVGKSQN